jgi:hypothetical protein
MKGRQRGDMAGHHRAAAIRPFPKHCSQGAGYPPTHHLAVKVRLFIDFLVERFSAGPEAGIGRSSTMDA